jgi:hypothetical protein
LVLCTADFFLTSAVARGLMTSYKYLKASNINLKLDL